MKISKSKIRHYKKLIKDPLYLDLATNWIAGTIADQMYINRELDFREIDENMIIPQRLYSKNGHRVKIKRKFND